MNEPMIKKAWAFAASKGIVSKKEKFVSVRSKLLSASRYLAMAFSNNSTSYNLPVWIRNIRNVIDKEYTKTEMH